MVNMQIFLMQQLFFTKSFSGSQKSYLLAFPDDNAESLAVCLSKLYRDLLFSILLIVLIFSLILIFTISSFYIVMDYLMAKQYHSLKIWFCSIIFIKLHEIFIIIAYKCNNTLPLVYFNIVRLHGQKLYHWKEHLSRITVIYFYCENL